MRATTRTLALLIVLLAGMAGPAQAALKGCDDLDPSVCLLPFPSDAYTSPAATPTGKHVDFPQLAMPRNVAGLPVDPTEWNRNDGFSPGSMAITFVPGLDLHRTFNTTRELIEEPALTVRRTRRGRLLSPILLIDTGPTGASARPRAQAVFAELDHHPKTPANQRLLLVRPLRNLLEGHRYVVILRDLRDGHGARIPAGAAFTRLRDRATGVEEPAGRVEHYERDIFPVLASLGVARDASLFLAWDFTVASEQNLTGRARAIRDDAFGKLGDRNLADGRIEGHAPSFKVASVTTAKDGTRTITGTVAVPNYLTVPPGVETPAIPDPTGKLTDIPPQAPPGDRFHYAGSTPGPMETPIQNPDAPVRDVEWVCTLPPTARPGRPATPMLYGHGLLGSKGESQGGSTARDRERNFMPCATDWLGFSSHDLANVVLTLTNLSTFGGVIDRAQQGFLNFMYLGRALKAADGLATNAAFRSSDGKPLIATGQLVYDGNSQGGIMGGALTALEPDLTNAVLGVTGMNYSTLLNRSVDWEGAYAEINYTAYPDKQVQQLDYGLLQMLWDRGEADGYALHMTSDPLPNTPPHRVLMHVGFGDYQVANVSAEAEARTIGAWLLRTSVPARHWAVDPAYGFRRSFGGRSRKRLDHRGSALVYFDSGNPTPPNANVPPPDHDADPHEIPRRDPFGAIQKERFLRTGVVRDVHRGAPYCSYAYPIDKGVRVPACERRGKG